MKKTDLIHIVENAIKSFFENEKGDLYDPATGEFAPGPRSRPEYWVRGKQKPLTDKEDEKDNGDKTNNSTEKNKK